VIFVSIAYFLRNKIKTVSFESWIFSGSVVGMTLAFHAPIAGFFYVAEKTFLSKTKELTVDLVFVLIATLIVSISSLNDQPLFGRFDVDFDVYNNFFLIILLTIICAISAFIFYNINRFIFQTTFNMPSAKWHFFVLFFGLLVALINNYAGIYAFGGGIETVIQLLNGQAHLGVEVVIARFVNSILTFGANCAGGLIAPVIAIGASIGSAFQEFFIDVDQRIFVIIAMTAFLAAIFKEPFTTSIIIYETTQIAITNIPLLAIVSVASVKIIKILQAKYDMMSNKE